MKSTSKRFVQHAQQYKISIREGIQQHKFLGPDYNEKLKKKGKLKLSIYHKPSSNSIRTDPTQDINRN